MSMFKKPKRNFRSRRKESESDEVDNKQNEEKVDNERENSKEEFVVKKIKKKKDRDKAAAAPLSFAADADDEVDGSEVFKIKKSSHSRRIAKQLKRESKKEKEKAEKQLAETTNSEPDVASQNDKLQNGSPKTEDMEYGSDVEETEKSENEEKGDKFDKISGQFRDILQSGQIPDATLIHMARKRRQRAREMVDEFIPLDSAERPENSSSRLVREDDCDKSDEDDDDARVSFTVPQRETELRQIQNTILAAEEESHSEGSDQEHHQWEQQQIRKGVSIPAQQVQAAVAPGQSTDYYNNYRQFMYGQQRETVFPSDNTPRYGYQPDMNSAPRSKTFPPETLPAITTEQVEKGLKERMDELCNIHRVHIQERDDLSSRVESSSTSITTMEGQTEGLENRYRFFQEMRGYVTDLVECLNEKMAVINYMERQMQHLLKSRADKLLKRRQEDLKDQSMDFMPGKVGAVAGVNPTEQDPAKQRRVAEREARRLRRKRAREQMNIQDHNEGMSSDDEESKSDKIRFNGDRERILVDVNNLFEDVVEDFSRLSNIKRRFESWKEEQGDSYREAYIGLCLPKLFSPIINLKLLDWNPLEEKCLNFENTRWYESLMFYGHREGVEPETEDPDLKLIPSIVEKVLLPKLTVLVENVWDPLSTRQTTRLVSMVKHLLTDYPIEADDSKNCQAFLKAVVLRVRRTLDDDVFIPLYPKVVLENKTSPATVFFYRQFWTCVKLLGNIFQWDGVISCPRLYELGLDSLLNRYLVLALQNSPVNPDSVNKSVVIAGTFPREWFVDYLQSDVTLPQLQNFCRYLVYATGELDKLSAGGSELQKKEARDCIKQITKLLMSMHAMNQALDLATKFRFKI